ncbi:MAG: SWIM zinc finger domain-containing protein [Burkholderiales bacterium]
MGKAQANARAAGLSALVTEASLRALAGEKSFARGKAYFAAGAVTSLIDSGETVKARVNGTDEYTVTLRANGKTLD